jgi:hypothetical protein
MTENRSRASCACDGYGQRKHMKNRKKTTCGKPTNRALFLDIDIKPLPLCDDCWILCWMDQLMRENGSRWAWRGYVMGMKDD